MRDSSISKTTSSKLDRLAADLAAAGVTRAQVEGVVYRFSPGERRLFLRLATGGTFDTMALRTSCSVGNVSAAVIALNGKLALAGDRRHVRCRMVPHKNRFREMGTIGNWSMTSQRGA